MSLQILYFGNSQAVQIACYFSQVAAIETCIQGAAYGRVHFTMEMPSSAAFEPDPLQAFPLYYLSNGI